MREEYEPGFSWNGYERTWKSDAFWVDLRPVKERVKSVQRYRQGRTDQARAYNTVGECAAAILLGGSVTTKTQGGCDVSLPSGEEFVVRTSFWGGGKKYAPAMTSSKRHIGLQNKLPTIWCVTKRYPECFDGAWVCGWMDAKTFYETRQAGAAKFSWAWINRWHDDGRFRHMGEIMEDELLDPRLPVGMTYRRSEEDVGIAEYLEAYGFLQAAADQHA